MSATLSLTTPEASSPPAAPADAQVAVVPVTSSPTGSQDVIRGKRENMGELLETRSDVELLEAVGDRDRSALGVLYERHAPWLRTRLDRRCDDRGLVEEVVQDTFLALWRKPGAFRGQGEVAAWIWGIGIRRLLAALRPRRAIPLPWIPDAAGPSAEDLVLLRLEHGDVGGAVDELPPELRSVVQAVVLDGLSSREAAQLLGVPPGTVRTRMMRARSQLREALT
jgi:RNA polymerase sigma-70 factor (ECF subfamily)